MIRPSRLSLPADERDSRFARGLRELLSAPHRQAARWPAAIHGSARIVRAVYAQDGYRSRELASDGPALPKRVSLRFEAKTDVPRPFKVYWQVVNTGREAGQPSQLRGTFEEHEPERGGLIKEESTLYSGTHSIQCFIVKDGRLLAQSQLFIVNIR